VTFSLAAACLLSIVSTAEPSTAESSNYEARLEQWALDLYHRERDPQPEGKRVGEILVASENIVGPEDPWPKLINFFHWKTKEHVIRQELLFAPGDPYTEWSAAESERNLRKLAILALVRVVPVKSVDPNQVDVLVVTKDLLSIRLNTEFNVVGSLVETLRIRPSELNFLGRNKQVYLDFLLHLDTLSVGEGYTDPRIAGTRLALSQSAAVIFNRHTQKPEGSRGQLTFGLPLYSLQAEHGFQLSGSWDVETVRLFRGASVWQLPFPNASAPTANIPFIYDAHELAATGTYTRSYGSYFKTNLSAGVGAYSRRYEPPRSSNLPDDQRAWLIANYLPLTEKAVYLTGRIDVFQAEYRILRDIETFALSEDYQLGYAALASIRWAEPSFGSTRRFLEGTSVARYRVYRFDDLATLSAGAAIRLESGSPDGFGAGWVNKRLALELVNISPVIGIGRIAARGFWVLNASDLQHRLIALGGGDGVRGIPPQALIGPNAVVFNLEYRSKAVAFQTVHVGFVAFWDAGSAYPQQPGSTNQPGGLTHTIGLGLRILLPQFNRVPIRIDFGYALNGPRPSFLDSISTSFGQVFDYRPALLDQFAD
jgi:hypothetical protein